ncbi:MAG: HAMP domain-containing sensor histidine kinase [Sulfurimonas sp.]|nr:HAMP domain-containing sensor histidine kinase [Sulfurimonas sp.]
MSYECLSAIGNSFELESMMSEIVITFYQSTKALYVGYYDDYRAIKPLISAGKEMDFVLKTYPQECLLQDEAKNYFIFLPLKAGFIKFVYSKEVAINEIYAMLCNFKRKINFAISACEGVKELQGLNENLESRITQAVKKIREHEEMLVLQSKNAIMGEMLEMIAHQWRQPITSIGMISNNMLFNIIMSEDEPLDKEFFKNDIDEIDKQIKYLSHTIDDFRSFFKESKTKEAVQIDSVLHRSVSLIKKQLEHSSIKVEINNCCDDLIINTYKNELNQVLLNILNNAKDAFETQKNNNKKITISTFTKDNNLFIEIKDNAGGISEDVIHKIFEPYFSTKKEKNGTGLGLYMSKIILQKHLNSEMFFRNEDGGAVFSIVMPVKK